jgi:hypothetical protein
MPNPEDSRHGRSAADDETEETVDVRDLLRRIGRGAGQTFGLALIAMVVAAALTLAVGRFLPITTSTRVVFSFPGFANGLYPDGSKFDSNDLIAPDVISAAILRAGLDTSSEFQARIRAALAVDGIMPPDIAKERDRARSLGQNPPPYVPDEYALTLTLKRDFPLARPQRAQLLGAIVAAYKQKFERTYVDVPLAFGSAFENLQDADYFEYELIMGNEIDNITTFLTNQIAEAKNFRSPTTNLSFSDLLDQTSIFAQIRLNGTLGLIHQNGLSKDRGLAMIKMDYYLQRLKDKEAKAIEEEKTIDDLLAKAQGHVQGYVLGIKSEANQPRSEAPVLDQGLIDSLVANDSYNFLVRKALDAGLLVKEIQSEEVQLEEKRANMLSFIHGANTEQTGIVARVTDSVAEMKAAYDELIRKIRLTQADYSRQVYANAVSISDVTRTEGMLKPLVESAAVGIFLGGALGIGLSLLGIYLGEKRKAE